jgi:hypothetical protein
VNSCRGGRCWVDVEPVGNRLRGKGEGGPDGNSGRNELGGRPVVIFSFHLCSGPRPCPCFCLRSLLCGYLRSCLRRYGCMNFGPRGGLHDRFLVHRGSGLSDRLRPGPGPGK